MSDEQVRVTFQPHGRAVFVLKGTKVLEAAARGGLILETPCGGQGTCGKCRLRLARGAGEPTGAEREALPAEDLRAGWRLACQSVVTEETVADVPSHAGVPGDASGRQRRQGRYPASWAAAAQGRKMQFSRRGVRAGQTGRQ